ncbi:MAG: hypothetical protein D3909_08495 [Candidatus Electrothrix sp. ATG1]|nr:hypothetical protein [Candidatus Electrothrix sp. ATG1]MCI5210722.1 hypothetical protein [Candidatus Electrothrix sp. ATG2]
MKPGKGQVQEKRRNARAVRTPNLGGLVRRNIQYRVGNCIMFPAWLIIIINKLVGIFKADLIASQ